MKGRVVYPLESGFLGRRTTIMSKDKSGKNSKLRRYDLFSIMLEQSSVFRDMVDRFQNALGLRHEAKQSAVAAVPVAPSSRPRKGVKTNKRAKATAGAKSSTAKTAPGNSPAVADRPANPAPVSKKSAARKAPAAAKKAPAKSAVKTATKKTVAKTAKKTAAKKSAVSRK